MVPPMGACEAWADAAAPNAVSGPSTLPGPEPLIATTSATAPIRTAPTNPARASSTLGGRVVIALPLAGAVARGGEPAEPAPSAGASNTRHDGVGGCKAAPRPAGCGRATIDLGHEPLVRLAARPVARRAVDGRLGRPEGQRSDRRGTSSVGPSAET